MKATKTKPETPPIDLRRRVRVKVDVVLSFPPGMPVGRLSHLAMGSPEDAGRVIAWMAAGAQTLGADEVEMGHVQFSEPRAKK